MINVKFTVKLISVYKNSQHQNITDDLIDMDLNHLGLYVYISDVIYFVVALFKISKFKF